MDNVLLATVAILFRTAWYSRP